MADLDQTDEDFTLVGPFSVDDMRMFLKTRSRALSSFLSAIPQAELHIGYLNYLVKNGLLQHTEDYVLLGHANEITDETLCLGVEHGGVDIVRFLVSPPQDAPIVPRAVRLALDWTRQHDGDMSMLEALHGGRSEGWPCHDTSCLDHALLHDAGFSAEGQTGREKRRAVATFLLDRGYKLSAYPFIKAVQRADIKELVWLQRYNPESDLGVLEETLKCEGAVVSAALETGKMELVLWAEGAGARMPQVVEPSVMCKAVQTGDVGLMRWMHERGLHGDLQDHTLIPTAITNANLDVLRELLSPSSLEGAAAAVAAAAAASEGHDVERRGVIMYAVDGQRCIDTMLQHGNAEMLQVLVKSRADCFNRPVVVSTLQSATLKEGAHVRSRRQRIAVVAARDGHNTCVSIGRGQEGIVRRATLEAVVIRWKKTHKVDAVNDETVSLLDFFERADLCPVRTWGTESRSHRSLYLHKCIELAITANGEPGERVRLLGIASVIIANDLTHIARQTWDLLLRDVDMYAALIAPLVCSSTTATLSLAGVIAKAPSVMQGQPATEAQ